MMKKLTLAAFALAAVQLQPVGLAAETDAALALAAGSANGVGLADETDSALALAGVQIAATGIALDHPEARWLVLGWGARDFYTTVGTYSDVTARAAE